MSFWEADKEDYIPLNAPRFRLPKSFNSTGSEPVRPATFFNSAAPSAQEAQRMRVKVEPAQLLL